MRGTNRAGRRTIASAYGLAGQPPGKKFGVLFLTYEVSSIDDTRQTVILDGWKLSLREGGRDALRNELASQIELEALRFSDPDKRAVLTLALKHFDAGEP